MKIRKNPNQLPLTAERSLLVSESGHSLTDASLSRRDFLCQGLIYGGVAMVSPLALFTQGCGTTTFQSLESAVLSEIPWLGWDREDLVSAAISWVVKHYVVPLAPDVRKLFPDVGDVRSAASALAKKLGLKKTNSPRPTGKDLHDSYAEKYVVTNRRYHRMYSGKFGCCVKQDHYLRCGKDMSVAKVGDLSALEIKAIAVYYRDHGKLLLPDGERKDPGRLVSSHEDWKLEYIRTFTDGPSRIKGYGFIHKRTQEGQFLFLG